MTQSTQLQAVRRTAAILRTLAAHPGGCSFTHLLTGEERLSAASLSRLLKVLVDEGLVAKDAASGSYGAGPDLVRLARGLGGSVLVRDVVQPVLEAVAADTRQSVAFFEPEPTGAVLTAKAEVEEGFHYIRLFQQMPELALHGFGQVLLAFTPAAARRRQAGAALPTPVAAYAQRLAAIRRGLAVLPDWRSGGGRGIVRIAAPVFHGPAGALGGVIGISFWTGSVPEERLESLSQMVGASARRATVMMPAPRDRETKEKDANA